MAKAKRSSNRRSQTQNERIKIFGIAAHALTANEARYRVGFRTVDEIRNRLAKANKRLISAYVQKELQGSLGDKLAQLQKQAA